MHTWIIYLEEADGNDERRKIGEINASTMAEALQKAGEYYEIPSHDLIAERKQ
jgi:hypothetical protein